MYLLQRADGSTDPDQVLKVVFKFSLGGVFGMTNLEREWRVGQHLALLTEPGEALPGFMGTGVGIVTKSGQFRGDLLALWCLLSSAQIGQNNVNSTKIQLARPNALKGDAKISLISTNSAECSGVQL